MHRWIKRIMKVLYCILIAILALSCASSKKSGSETLTGNWELSFFPTTDKTFDEIFGQRRPQLQFNNDNKTVTGTTGCNRLSGSYSRSGHEFSFGTNFITTKMACPGYEESIFLESLNRVNRYELVNGQLRFQHDSSLVMSFIRKP